jgi:hypothetical protein
MRKTRAVTKYWIGVVHRSHALVGAEEGFARTNHGRKFGVARMSPGDGFVYYSPKETYPDGPTLRAFTAIGTVDDGELWQADEGEWQPWQRAVTYDRSAHEAPIRPLLEALEFSRGGQNWGLVMQRGHVEISRHDFAIIAAEMGSDILAG